MPKTDPTAERAARLTEVLRQRRDQGEAAYPLTVAQLGQVADPGASEEDIFKALGKKSHAGNFVIAGRKDPASPVALAEDRELLLKSPLLLKYALRQVCSAEKPLQPVKKIVAAIDKDLRDDFQKALEERIQANAWPDGVGCQNVKKDVPGLYLQEFPPPAPKKSPATELAEKLLATLRTQKEHGGEAYPATLAKVVELAQAEGGKVKKALANPAFASHAQVIPAGKAETFVVLNEDKALLLDSPRLLETLLRASTSPKKPGIATLKLAELLPEGVRDDFLDAIDQHIEKGTLPSLIGARTVDGRLELHLKENVPDHLSLADQLLATLHQLREQPDRYPLTWSQLLHQAAPQAAPALVEKVLQDKSFKNDVVFALSNHPDSPVVLKGDEDKLVNSPRTLEFAVGLVSTAEKPIHPIKSIAAKLDKPVRDAVEQALAKHVEDKALPAGISTHDLKGRPHLHLSQFPPPRDPVEDLVNGLLSALRTYRDQGGPPVTLSSLLASVAGGSQDEIAKKALAQKGFSQAVLLAQPGNPHSLVALVEDRDKLLASPRLLEDVLGATRTADNQAVPIPELGKKLNKDLQGPFIERLEERAARGEQPAGVGCLRIKGRAHLFLVTDVNTPAPPPAPKPVPAQEKPAVAPAEEPKPERAAEEEAERVAAVTGNGSGMHSASRQEAEAES
jgi:hypothetical protein